MHLFYRLFVQQSVCGSRATLCGAVVHDTGRHGTVVALAGEDNALRLVHVRPVQPSQILATINSHISVVRGLTVIQKQQGTFHFNMHPDYLVDYCGPRGADETSNNVWLVSVGGRAQLKVWMMDVTNIHSVIECSSHSQKSDRPILQCSEVISHQLREENPTSWRCLHAEV